MHCLDSGSWWEVYACYEVEVDMLKVKFKKAKYLKQTASLAPYQYIYKFILVKDGIHSKIHSGQR